MEKDPSVRELRGTESDSEVIDRIYEIVEGYITMFWVEVQNRVDQTDLSVGPMLYSKVPTESICFNMG